jgi:hypothetical protein
MISRITSSSSKNSGCEVSVLTTERLVLFHITVCKRLNINKTLVKVTLNAHEITLLRQMPVHSA